MYKRVSFRSNQIPESVLLEDSNRSDGGSNESKA